MRVVIIGPGRIGCGYLAPLFQSAGCEVVLVARTKATAERIRRSGHYSVRIAAPLAAANGNGSLDVTVPHAVAINSSEFMEVVAGADLICTAVGVGKVRSLAAPLAWALATRPPSRPIDVWTVENGDCAGELEAGVQWAAREAGFDLPPVGFAGAVASVAVTHGSWRTEGWCCPKFVGDTFRSLRVDERRVLTGIPALPAVTGTKHYLARLHEKLYVFNAGHAIGAYLGWLRRHRTIADAATDPLLRPLLADAVFEARRALLSVHPSLGSDLEGAVDEALARFANRDLADPIDRVAREPIRKLAPVERLLAPAELIRRMMGRVPDHFAFGVAGALLYRNEEDDQSCRLGDQLAGAGLATVLESVCGLTRSHPFAEAVAKRYWSLVMPENGSGPAPVVARPLPATRTRSATRRLMGNR